jgi:hypothetical protein
MLSDDKECENFDFGQIQNDWMKLCQKINLVFLILIKKFLMLSRFRNIFKTSAIYNRILFISPEWSLPQWSFTRNLTKDI